MSGIRVLGSGGSSNVVDILLTHGLDVTGFLNDDPTALGMTVLSLPLLGSLDTFSTLAPSGPILVFGNNCARAMPSPRSSTPSAPPGSTSSIPVRSSPPRLGLDVSW